MSLEKTISIDNVDVRIIGHLLEDARKSFVEIGKEIGISKNAVWTRYQKLVDNKVITGSTIQINYKKLGFDCVGTLLLEVEPAHIEQISNYIKTKIPDVFGPTKFASRCNLRAIVTLKTISELGAIKEDLRKQTPVIELESSIWTDVWFTPENLSLIPVKPIESEKENSDSVFFLDETDLKIVRELTEDSRISFRTLATKLNLSTDTIVRRYEKLKENSIIVARIQIDPSKIGYHAVTHFYLRIMPQFDADKIIRELIKIPDIYYVLKCTGDYNIGVMMLVKNVQDMLKTGETISQIPGLKRIETVTNPAFKSWPLPRTYTSTLHRK